MLAARRVFNSDLEFLKRRGQVSTSPTSTVISCCFFVLVEARLLLYIYMYVHIQSEAKGVCHMISGGENHELCVHEPLLV